jgi:lambda family phage portal protein
MKEIQIAQETSPLDIALKASNPNTFSRVIDAIIEPFAPSYVSKRCEARRQLGYQRAMLSYAAAYRSYERPFVSEPLVSEEAALPGYDRFQLIIESRNLYRNSPIIRAGINGIATRAIATGINPHFTTDDEEWNKEATRQWMEWCEYCDVRGIMDFRDMQKQAIRSCFYDGDIGFLFVDEDDDLRLQAIESDLIAQNNRVGINMDSYNPIGGVYIDKNTGRPTDYQVGRRGPGGMLVDSEKIPAHSFMLLFRPQRVDQVRGVPLLAPVIDTAKDLDRYINATRVQANIAATYGVVVKRDMAAQIAMATSKAVQNDATYRTQQLKTGLMTFLNPGESIETFKPDVPGPQFDPFAKFMVRLIAIGMGTTYEYLMQDYSNMSFSSSKTNLMDTTLTLQEWQRFIKVKFCDRVFPVWVAKRMESGRLGFNKQAYDRVIWNQPAKLGVDPQADSAANVQNLSAGLDTYANLLQERGIHDWKAHLAQKADEVAHIQKLAKERGITTLEISSTLPPGVLPPGEQEQADQDKKQKIRAPVGQSINS